LENDLVREFTLENKLTDILALLDSTGSSEAKKYLAEYYFQAKNYSYCRNLLGDVTNLTTAEAQYQDSITAYDNQRENFNYNKYYTIMVNLADSAKTIYQMDNQQYWDLQDVVAAKVKVSVNAEMVLTAINNSDFKHPIRKTNEKRMVNNKPHSNAPSSSANTVNIFPNPNNGTMELKYNIASKSSIIIYDITGKECSTYYLNPELHNYSINNSDLENGIYSYKVLSDKTLISTGKLVIIK